MTAQEAIDTAVQRLVTAANPKKVILFGSFAEGTVTSESDVDLLVIEHEVASKRTEMVRLRKAIGQSDSRSMCLLFQKGKFQTGDISLEQLYTGL